VGNEEADIRAAGFDPFGTIRTTDIYQQPFADGVAVFGGISDNLWIPTLTGAQARSSRVTICALSIANDGTARVREFVLSYDNEAELRARLKPMIYDLQMLNSPSAVNVAVERLMRDSSSSASFFRQFIQEYYLVLIEERGGFRIDGAAFEAQVRAGRYSEADRAIIEAVRNKTPWIV
jgi:hypothetical protein